MIHVKKWCLNRYISVVFILILLSSMCVFYSKVKIILYFLLFDVRENLKHCNNRNTYYTLFLYVFIIYFFLFSGDNWLSTSSFAIYFVTKAICQVTITVYIFSSAVSLYKVFRSSSFPRSRNHRKEISWSCYNGNFLTRH